MSKWFVSRQCYWGVDPDEQNVVEIAAGGLDYANPDMLVNKYAGEGEEYNDPREAVETALEIARQWKSDCPKLIIDVAHGATGGMTLPFEASEVEELKVLELVTDCGSRFYGFEKIWIGSDLEMHCKGFDHRFEEVSKWKDA